MPATINGLDLLIAAICLILLLVIWYGAEKYYDWYDFNHWRRRKRTLDRARMRDEMAEKQYRRRLKFYVALVSITINVNKFTEAIKRAGKSIDKFSLKMGSVSERVE